MGHIVCMSESLKASSEHQSMGAHVVWSVDESMRLRQSVQ